MLHFVVGKICSGKTTKIHSLIKDFAESGSKNMVLLVPEQYSFETEKQMLHLLGAEKMNCVEVLSFSFLAKEILKKHGQSEKPCVDDSVRMMLMSLTLESVGDKLNIYGKHKYSPALIKEMLDVVREFNQSAFKPKDINSAALKMKKSMLQSKLKELAIISEAYNAVVQNSYYDDESSLDKLYDVLQEDKFFDGKIVFIDGFRGFTKQELKIIENILTRSEVTYVTLCADTLKRKNNLFSQFAHTRNTAEKIRRIAVENNVPVAKTDELSGVNKFNNFPPHFKRYSNNELEVLENELYNPEINIYPEKTENITICSAKDFNSECEFVAMSVKKIIREDGLRCRDIAIISRSQGQYENSMKAALDKFGVPVYIDRRQPIVTQPLVRLISAAVDIAKNGFLTESIMRYLKTGISGIDANDISIIENYTLLWQINGNAWLREWKGHPDGLGEEFIDKHYKLLQKINDIRVKIISPLQSLKKVMNDADGCKAAKAVYDLLTEIRASENLKVLALSLEESGEYELAGEQNEIWDIIMNILDGFACTFKGIRLTSKRFAELFELVTSTYSYGELPVGLDEITIGSADRIRISSKKAVFVVGVNDSVFPLVPSNGNILNNYERKILEGMDIELGGTYENKLLEERFIAYNTLCSAQDKLIITYSGKDSSGEELTPSELISKVIKIFPECNVVDTALLKNEEFIEGEVPAFEVFANESKNKSELFFALKAYFEADKKYSGKIAALNRVLNKQKFKIENQDTATKLFGKDMYLSASKIEVYHKCPFEFFCRYGLNAKPLKVASLDPMQRGTIIHYVLENIIKIYGAAEFIAMSEEVRDKKVVEIFNEYVTEKMSAEEEKGDRFDYLCTQLCQMICSVAGTLAQQLSVSDFVPVDFELKINNDAQIKPYTVKIADGSELKIIGSVDRVDLMKTDDKSYIRVIDYKSGIKKFALSEVFGGLNMQMLIYLIAICKNGKDKYGDSVPAGVLYMPVNASDIKLPRDADYEATKLEKLKNAKMNGLILNNSIVITGMENDGEGIFIPAKFSEKEGIYKGSLITEKQFGFLSEKIDKILNEMVINLHKGKIDATPSFSAASGGYKNVCEYCDYKTVCAVEKNRLDIEIKSLKHDECLKILDDMGDEDNA